MYMLHENNKSDIEDFVNYFKSYLLNIKFSKMIVTNFKKRFDLEELHVSIVEKNGGRR